MKTLTTEDLIDLLPPSDDLVNEALRQFELSAPILCREPGYCKHLVDEGWLNLTQLNWRGRPAYLLGWHLSPDGGFWLDIVKGLDSGAPYTVAVSGSELLASQKHARYVRWLTLRRGIVRWAHEQGYTAEAVILTKVL